MLIKHLLHLAEGTVRIRVEAPFPERIFNLFGSNAMAFWDVERTSPTGFACTLARKDYRRLRRLGESLPCEIRVERRRGAPYLAKAFRRRMVLTVSLLAALGVLILGSFCVWDFEIEGETAVSDKEILRALQKYGVGLGTFSGNIDSEDLRNHILLDLPELSWITVNVRGFRAYVQVRPRTPKPQIVDEKTPVNIVARRSGVVQRIEALGGEAVVLPGSTVAEGDLLISGASHRGGREVELLAAMGEVEARTWYTLSAAMPLTLREKEVREEKTVLSLLLGTRRIKICGSSRYDGEEYDKITDRMKWDLFGLLPLPITTVKERIRLYETAERGCSAAEAKTAGEELLQAYLQTLLPEDGEVLASLCTAEERGGLLLVTLRAECLESIGKAVEIPQA